MIAYSASRKSTVQQTRRPHRQNYRARPYDDVAFQHAATAAYSLSGGSANVSILERIPGQRAESIDAKHLNPELITSQGVVRVTMHSTPIDSGLQS